MAVSNAPTPNLSSSYRDVIDAMNNRANLELKRPQLADVGAVAATRVDQELTKQRDFAMKMQAEGRIKVDDSVIKPLADSSGIEPSYWNKYKNLYMKPEELQSYGEQEKLARSFKENGTETKQSNAARVNPKAASESIFANKTNKWVAVKDENSSTGYYYYEPRPGGQSINTGNEAPDPTRKGGGGGGNRPTKINPDDGELIYTDNGEHLTGPPPLPKDKTLADSQKYLYQKEKQTLESSKKLYTKDAEPSQATLKELDRVAKQVKENNPVGFFNAKIGLVRLGGISAGRIAQGEIVQEAGARDIISQGQQRLETFTKGDWTDKNKQFIMQYIDSLRKVEQEHLSNVKQQHFGSTVQQLPRVDPDFIDSYLEGQAAGKKLAPMPPAPAPINISDPKTAAAAQYLKAHGKAINSKNVSTVLSDPKTYDISSFLGQ